VFDRSVRKYVDAVRLRVSQRLARRRGLMLGFTGRWNSYLLPYSDAAHSLARARERGHEFVGRLIPILRISL
jgi:hypothetical protein